MNVCPTAPGKRLSMAFRTPSGSIDLASIMAGVIVLAVIALGGVAATTFAVIPWAQDGAAKASLHAYQTAQSVAQAREGRFLSTSELVDHGYLPEKARAAASGPAGLPQGGRGMSVSVAEPPAVDDGLLRTVLGADGSCYIANLRSGTGTVFYITSKNPTPEAAPSGQTPDTEWCTGGPEPAPPAAEWSWSENQTAGVKAWTRPSYSPDNKGISVEAGGSAYRSPDAGATWVYRPAGSGVAAFSDDGTKGVVAPWFGYIQSSPTGKAPWLQSGYDGRGYWYDTAVSSDGSTLVASGYGAVSISTDGINWTKRLSSAAAHWNTVAVSADGSKLITTAEGTVYVSVNDGLSWTNRAIVGLTESGVSADGSHFAVVATSGIYTSDDKGQTWQNIPAAGSHNWSSIAVSNDGTHMVAGTINDYLYASDDAGATWVEQTAAGSRKWSGVAISPDGKHAVGVVNNGHIYTGELK